MKKKQPPVWFVSVSSSPRPGETSDMDRTVQKFTTLGAAKTFAREALIMGFQIEAGTVDGVEPAIKIEPKDAAAWAFAR